MRKAQLTPDGVGLRAVALREKAWARYRAKTPDGVRLRAVALRRKAWARCRAARKGLGALSRVNA